eukprot:scaffold27794_cov106-Isochrysis_galbana.AAC.2
MAVVVVVVVAWALWCLFDRCCFGLFFLAKGERSEQGARSTKHTPGHPHPQHREVRRTPSRGRRSAAGARARPLDQPIHPHTPHRSFVLGIAFGAGAASGPGGFVGRQYSQKLHLKRQDRIRWDKGVATLPVGELGGESELGLAPLLHQLQALPPTGHHLPQRKFKGLAAPCVVDAHAVGGGGSRTRALRERPDHQASTRCGRPRLLGSGCERRLPGGGGSGRLGLSPELEHLRSPWQVLLELDARRGARQCVPEPGEHRLQLILPEAVQVAQLAAHIAPECIQRLGLVCVELGLGGQQVPPAAAAKRTE